MLMYNRYKRKRCKANTARGIHTPVCRSSNECPSVNARAVLRVVSTVAMTFLALMLMVTVHDLGVTLHFGKRARQVLRRIQRASTTCASATAKLNPKC